MLVFMPNEQADNALSLYSSRNVGAVLSIPGEAYVERG